MSCERVRETNTLARSGQLWESIVITMVGYNKHKLLGTLFIFIVALITNI